MKKRVFVVLSGLIKKFKVFPQRFQLLTILIFAGTSAVSDSSYSLKIETYHLNRNFSMNGIFQPIRRENYKTLLDKPVKFEKGPFYFNGTISRETLENYLDRSVTMGYFLAPGKPEGYQFPYKNDDIRLIKNIGAKFIGRAIYRWSEESRLGDPSFLAYAKAMIDTVHSFDPEVIFQGCLFEFVSNDVNKLEIPAWVFTDLGLPVEDRTFSCDSIIKRKDRSSCISPGGYRCKSLPFLVEFDNYGRGKNPNAADTTSIFVWGWDEISWFSLQKEEYRNNWLVYAYNWIRKTDTNGHLQMPVTRMITCPNETLRSYFANTKSPTCPIGYSQEETIKKIWNNEFK
jgi:hypothetical protein